MLTIVMYHYVRNLPHTPYPQIKGLLTQDFNGQLDYITQYYTVCPLSAVVAARLGGEPLPPNACLLTFDDGFIDHYLTVFPLLAERKLSGSFFIPAQPVLEQKVVDVHKIHFILATAKNPSNLGNEILALVDTYRPLANLPSNERLMADYAKPGRYDSAEIRFVKNLLQYALPNPIRAEVVDTLFARHVTTDETAFAENLYVNFSQIRAMLAGGMEIGGHGYHHLHFSELSSEEKQAEIAATRQFLEQIRLAPAQDWTMCYPHGSYDAETIQFLAEAGCKLGLTTEVNLNTTLDTPFQLSRINTNDLPHSGKVEPVSWTTLALDG